MSILAALTKTRKPSPATVGTGDDQITVWLCPVAHSIASGFSAIVAEKGNGPEAQLAAGGYVLHALVVEENGERVFSSAEHAQAELAAAPLDGPLAELLGLVMAHITATSSRVSPKSSPPTTDSVG